MATVNNAEPSIAKDQLRRIKRDLADPFEYTAKAMKPARTPKQPSSKPAKV